MPLMAILPTDRLQKVRRTNVTLPQFLDSLFIAVVLFRSAGALSAYIRAACAAGPGIESDHGPRRSASRPTTSRRETAHGSTACSHYISVRSMATALLPRERTTKSCAIPLHIQYILQKAVARAGAVRHLRQRVSRQARRILCGFCYPQVVQKTNGNRKMR
jgi:hypothetical protein